MTNQWDPFNSNDSSASESTGPTHAGSHDSTPPTEATHDEATRIIAPLQTDAVPPAPRVRRRTGVLPAAILAGALVVGGSAGVGGAAAYEAFRSSDASATSSDGGTGGAANTSPVIDSTSTTAIEQVSKQVLPSVVQINVAANSEEGTGSGIILDASGTILTNNHVVAVAGDGGTISVNFADGSSAKATVVGTDPVTDLAVIKAEGVSGLTPAKIGNSDTVAVGEGVVAIGSPYGLGATVTSGIVSALNRAVSVSAEEQAPQQQNPFGFGQGQEAQPQQTGQATTYPAIQTDAAINPGNSGGPLVNLAGEVVGVNSSIRTADSSASSGGSIGLGFAIPISEAMPIVKQIQDGATPTHARLGISVGDSTDGSSGAVVKSVESGGSAADAGLRNGDVITKVDEDVIGTSDDLVATIRGHRPDDTVTLTIRRGGETQTMDAKLGSDANSTTS